MGPWSVVVVSEICGIYILKGEMFITVHVYNLMKKCRRRYLTVGSKIKGFK